MCCRNVGVQKESRAGQKFPAFLIASVFQQLGPDSLVRWRIDSQTVNDAMSVCPLTLA